MTDLVVTVARKPTESGLTSTLVKWGTGSLNVDGTRIPTDDDLKIHTRKSSGLRGVRNTYSGGNFYGILTPHQTPGQQLGRWPANLILLCPSERDFRYFREILSNE